MTSVSLQSLLVSSKATTLDFPGFNGFTVDLNFLSRETLVNIRKKATKNTYKGRELKEELNDDLFLQLYSAAAIKGWNGLTFKTLEQLAPVDISGQKPEDELEFSADNALFLMKNSTQFDSFVSESVTELGNFQKPSAKK